MRLRDAYFCTTALAVSARRRAFGRCEMPVSSEQRQWLRTIVCASRERRECLHALGGIAPPDAWLSAGFVRNAVFSELFGPQRVQLESDLDVIYLDERATDPERDLALERELFARAPALWSVKNQVRMSQDNGLAPYRDVQDALAHFPETATAVAVRMRGSELEVLAPYGLDDLRAGVIRATPLIRREVFLARCDSKRWLERWPGVRVVR